MTWKKESLNFAWTKSHYGTGLDETLVSVSISRISRSKFLVSVSSRSRKIIIQNSRSRLGLEKKDFESSRLVSILGVFFLIFENCFSSNSLKLNAVSSLDIC